jgi:hypothetical protein
MANMHVGMTLTLADTASAPLRAFIGIVERLQTTANRLAPRLEAMAVGLTSINRAATGSGAVQAMAGRIEALNTRLGATQAAARGAASGIGNVSARASAGGTAVYALEQAIGALTGGLSRIAAHLNATTAGLQQMGGAARQAGAGAQAGLAATGAAAQIANQHVGTLRQTMVGMAQLWGAMKIKDGFVASVTGASAFETSKARAQTMGLTDGERGRIETAALAAKTLVPQFDRRQTFEMAIDLKNAMNSLDNALKVLPEMAQFAQNLKSQTKDGKIDDNILVNVGKILQQRGAVTDPAKMRAEADMLLKIMTATQGRVNVETMFSNLSQMKGALSGDNVSRDFLPILAGLAEMNRNGNGGTLGTQLTTATRYVMGNVRHGSAAKATNELGLFEDPAGLKWNTQGNIDLQKSNLRMKGARLWQENPMEWVKQFLIPAMQAKGMDITDNNLVSDVINQIMPARNAAEIVQTMTTKRKQLDADAANVNRAMGSQEQTEINSQTSQAKWDALTGKVRDLAIVVGEKLLPTLRVVADVMATMLDGVGAFFKAFPASATFLVWVTALGAVGLAVRGFMSLFGILGTFTGLIGGVGTAATAAGAAANAGFFARLAGFGTAVTGMAGVVLGAFARLLPLVGLLIIAWDLTQLVGKIEVFGKSLKAWASDLADFVIARFKSMFGFMGMAFEAGKTTGRWLADSAPGGDARTGPRRGGTAAEGRALVYVASDGSAGDFARLDRAPDAGRMDGRSGFEGAYRGMRVDTRAPAVPGAGSGGGAFGSGAPGGGGKRRVAIAPDGTLVLMPDNREAGRAAVRDGDPYYTGSAEPAGDYPDNREAGRDAVRAGDPHYYEQVAVTAPKAATALGAYSQAMSDVAQSMGEAARSGFGDMFSGILRGTERGGKALERFFQNMKNRFLDMIGQKLGDALFDSLFGSLLGGGKGGKSGGDGGWLGLLFKGVGALFGGGGGGSTGTSMGGWVSGGGYSVGGAGAGMATGTNYVPRDMIALIHRGEAVVPKQFNPAAMGIGAGGAAPGSMHVSFDRSMRNERVIDLLDAHIQRELATR